MTTHMHAAPNGTSEPTHEKSASVMVKPYSLYTVNDFSMGDDHPNAAPAAKAPPVAVFVKMKRTSQKIYYNWFKCGLKKI